MKKILYAILVAMAITSIKVNAKNAQPYYTNNNGIEISEKQYQNLKGLGFTDSQIAKMNTKTFNKNKNIEATIVDQTVNHYVKVSYLKNGLRKEQYQVVTEKEYNGRLINPGATIQSVSGNYYNGLIANDDLAVVTTISNINDSVMQYRVDVYNYTVPEDRYIDIYGVGIESGKVQIALAIDCLQSWDYSNGSSGSNDACYPKTESTGGSAMFELPTSNSITNLETYVSFWVVKKPNVGTINYLEAVGDYAHAIHSVSNDVYNHYTINVGGINVYSPYISSYDYFNTPSAATFEGTW